MNMERINFRTFITVEDADGGEVEVDVEVRGVYYPGSPGTWYRRNGDPGDPPEPAEWELTSVIGEWRGNKRHDFSGELSESTLERIEAEATESE